MTSQQGPNMQKPKGQAVPINCVVKPPIHIKVGDYKTEFHSGCAIMDIKFPNVFRVEVGEIVFRNYYAASVTVKAREKVTMADGATQWRTLVRNMTLMPYPHYEENSQSYFTIKKKQMLFDPSGINGLRFILRQPSPVWKEFKLEEIKIYKNSSQELPDVHIPPWIIKQLVEQNKKEKEDGEEEEEEVTKQRTKFNEIKYIEGVPHIDVVTEGLQQLWAMTQQVKAAQTRTAIGRYDVDGSYEINLLSYT